MSLNNRLLVLLIILVSIFLLVCIVYSLTVFFLFEFVPYKRDLKELRNEIKATTSNEERKYLKKEYFKVFLIGFPILGIFFRIFIKE